jgi:hypothetical protein
MSEVRKLSTEEIMNLLENDPWWKEISDEMDRVGMVHRLKGVVPDRHKAETVQTMLEYTFITIDKLNQASTDPVYVEALTIISGLNPGDKFPDRLFELFESQIPQALDRIDQAALQLMPLISDAAVRTELTNLWTSNREAIQAIDLNSLPTKLYVATPDERYVIRALKRLQELDDLFRNYQHYPFCGEDYFQSAVTSDDAEGISVGIGPTRWRDKLLAYRVYDPLWDRRMEESEPQYVSFRLKWAHGALSMSEVTQLYRQHKAGRDVISAFISFYEDENRLKRLRHAINTCPITKNYGELFGEAVDSFSDGRHKVCSIALLPIIEGIIWEYAWWWNKIHGGLFDTKITYEQYQNGIGFQLLKSDGTRAGGRPNVGQLLRQTKFGEDVHFEVVEYLCEELFGERNPVLHGRKPDYGEHRKAAALLFVVETLERQMTNAIKDKVGEDILQRIEKSATTETPAANSKAV